MSESIVRPSREIGIYLAFPRDRRASGLAAPFTECPRVTSAHGKLATGESGDATTTTASSSRTAAPPLPHAPLPVVLTPAPRWREPHTATNASPIPHSLTRRQLSSPLTLHLPFSPPFILPAVLSLSRATPHPSPPSTRTALSLPSGPLRARQPPSVPRPSPPPPPPWSSLSLSRSPFYLASASLVPAPSSVPPRPSTFPTRFGAVAAAAAAAAAAVR
ncbi:hypothetical protein PUN28_003853 [Cardiocondyla obscurior]|uniref:Uncharacterized protein n=1 Tax=Cardiocondyla obscurior TaxID=286306 RepID=A0AAW2GMC1_9HYME